MPPLGGGLWCCARLPPLYMHVVHIKKGHEDKDANKRCIIPPYGRLLSHTFCMWGLLTLHLLIRLQTYQGKLHIKQTGPDLETSYSEAQTHMLSFHSQFLFSSFFTSESRL